MNNDEPDESQEAAPIEELRERVAPAPIAETTVKVRSVDAILAECANPNKPSSPAVAEALLSLQRQVLLINRNQSTLQTQNQSIGHTVDRMTAMVFDTSDGAGGVRNGLASELRAMFERVLELEKRSSAYVLFSTATVEFLRVELPKLIQKNDGRFPTPDECEISINTLIREIHQKGEDAAKERSRIEMATQKMLACRFCKNWCTSSILVPGEDLAQKCDQPFVQLACPKCIQVYVTPVDPMNVPADARCAECQTPLQREVLDENGVPRTLCQMFEIDVDRARKDLLDTGFMPDHVDAVFPTGPSQIETNIGSQAPGEFGEAEVPPGPTRPLIE